MASGSAAPSTVPLVDASTAGRAAAALRDPAILLATAAFAAWLAGHVPAFAPVAIPAWVALGAATGLVRPWHGVLLTVVVVPFLGGAADQMDGEVLRVVPVYGAAVRVLLDRFVIAPGTGRPTPRDPRWWVVAAAICAAALYGFTAMTAYFALARDPAYLDGAFRWVIGGSAAMMAAWVAASHAVAGRERTLVAVVLGVTVAACLFALLAYAGAPGIDLVTFPGTANGRLAGLGWHTPTAMGLAIVLPIAVAGAVRIRPWLAIPVAGLVLVTMVLTWSRGPLIAVGVSAAATVLASGRVDRRVAVAGLAAGAAVVVGLVAIRYGTDPTAIVGAIGGSTTEDVNRVRTWVAAIAIAAREPLVGGGWHSLERYGDFASYQVTYAHNILLFAFAEGGLPLGIANAVVIVGSAWMTWIRRRTMAVWLVTSVVAVLACGIWDMPQVRSYAAVMGGMVLGMAAGPLIGREVADEPGAPEPSAS